MTKFIVRVLVVTCLAVIGYFLLSLVSAISQIASFTDRALPGSAIWVFWVLFLFFSVLLTTPLYFFFRLPKPPTLPADDDPVTKEVFRDNLREHLNSNPRLKDKKLTSNDEIDPVLSKLEEEADAIIKNTASSVFLSTAVMQNGRLDALFVLACQLRMVWRIATIFHGRPSPRHMLYLYGNVGSSVLIADNIQEIDFASITAPIITSIFPSIQGIIPGLQGISTLLINSLANGTANAFLTLRVGLIAKEYCMPRTIPKKDIVRKESTSKSLNLVKDIVNKQGKRVAETVWDTVKDAPRTMVNVVTEGLKDFAIKTDDVTLNKAKAVSKTFGDSMRTVKDKIKHKLEISK